MSICAFVGAAIIFGFGITALVIGGDYIWPFIAGSWALNAGMAYRKNKK